MVIKVYISGISGNKEVKKRQQRVLMILDSKHVSYDVVDITEPGKEQEKEFMQQNGNAKDAKYPLPPQIFNEGEYCGDYEEFDLANEIDELDKFLKVTLSDKNNKTKEIKENSESGQQVNGHASSSREASSEKEPSVEEPSSAAEKVEEKVENNESVKEEEKEDEEQEQEKVIGNNEVEIIDKANEVASPQDEAEVTTETASAKDAQQEDDE